MQGARILELGCGTGAVGIYAAGLGASDVVMTDVGDNENALLRLAAANIRSNTNLFSEQRVCRVAPYAWGSALTAIVDDGTGLDLVLGSDLTYARKSHRALCETLVQVLTDPSRFGSPRVILAHEHRRFAQAREGTEEPGPLPMGDDDEGFSHFIEVADGMGLRVARLDGEAQAKHGLRDISLLEISSQA